MGEISQGDAQVLRRRLLPDEHAAGAAGRQTFRLQHLWPNDVAVRAVAGDAHATHIKRARAAIDPQVEAAERKLVGSCVRARAEEGIVDADPQRHPVLALVILLRDLPRPGRRVDPYADRARLGQIANRLDLHHGPAAFLESGIRHREAERLHPVHTRGDASHGRPRVGALTLHVDRAGLDLRAIEGEALLDGNLIAHDLEEIHSRTRGEIRSAGRGRSHEWNQTK